MGAAQHGAVGRSQLLAAGLSRRQIERRLQSGHLHLVHRGVYAVGHVLLASSGRYAAAALAGGPDAALSHRSAAAIWDIRPDARVTVDVTAVRRLRHRPGVRMHHARLEPWERTERGGLPVTTLARTLLDVAEHVTARDLLRALERAERLEVLDMAALETAIASGAGRAGLGVLARALADYDPRHGLTRSELERLALELIDVHGLPRPEVNSQVCGFEVDLLWRSAGLVAELDGWEWHRTRRAFERDRRRDLALAAAGLTCVRLTWRALTTDRTRTMADLRARVPGGPER